MDPLTHGMTGLVLSRAGLSRWHRHSSWLLLLAAEAPDIDIVSAFGGSYGYFVHHRAITHSLVGAPVLAAILALFFCAIERSWRPLRAGFLLALVGVASHLLLDWTNAYGVRFLLPFSQHWYSLDVTNVVDVWIWLVLLIATFGPLLGRLVSSEMGVKGGAGRGIAVFALVFLGCYNIGRGFLHSRAIQTLESRIYDGAAPLRTGAMPTLFNALDWQGIVETRVSVREFDLSLTGPFDPDSGARYEKPESNPALQAAAGTDVFRHFLNFSKFTVWSVVPAASAENTTRVEATDVRFGFQASALVDAANHVRQANFQFR